MEGGREGRSGVARVHGGGEEGARRVFGENGDFTEHISWPGLKQTTVVPKGGEL